MIKTDYNKIASGYDERYRSNNLNGVEKSLLSIASASEISSILEVGCGTGKWLNTLAALNKKLVGLDYSSKMLEVAHSAMNNYSLINADACKLPFAKNIFDMIYCVNAIHHFPDKEKFLSDAVDALADDGVLCIYGVDPHIDKNWYVYTYFENVYEKDLERFPSLNATKELCLLLGLKLQEQIIVEDIYLERTGEEIFSDPFLKKHMNSQLANLSDDEYQKGIEKIMQAIRLDPGIKFITDIKFYLTKARKES